jgi:hypothetical protein
VDNGGRIVFGHGLDLWACGKKPASLQAKLQGLYLLDFHSSLIESSWPSRKALQNALENLGSILNVDWIKVAQAFGQKTIVELAFNTRYENIGSFPSFGTVSCRCCEWDGSFSSLRSQRNQIDILCRCHATGSLKVNDSCARQRGGVFSLWDPHLCVHTQQSTILYQGRFEVYPGKSMIRVDFNDMSEELANLDLASSCLSDPSHVYYVGASSSLSL